LVMTPFHTTHYPLGLLREHTTFRLLSFASTSGIAEECQITEAIKYDYKGPTSTVFMAKTALFIYFLKEFE
jgi:hypothetical protein